MNETKLFNVNKLLPSFYFGNVPWLVLYLIKIRDLSETQIKFPEGTTQNVK